MPCVPSPQKNSASEKLENLFGEKHFTDYATFYCVDFDNEVPSMADMQASLLNETDEDVITPLCQTILLAALDDPGVEGPWVSRNKLLICASITTINMSLITLLRRIR